MTHQYYFCIPYHENLIRLLESNNIRYRLSSPLGECFTNGTPVPVLVTFEFKGYLPIVDKIATEFRHKPRVSVVYTAAEIHNAKLLWITPKRQSIDILNLKTVYSLLCQWQTVGGMPRVHRREQIAPFVIEKEPSAKKTAFWASSTGFSEIFTDNRVRELAMTHNLQGVKFVETILPNGSFSDNIFQITANERIGAENIVFGKGEKEITCSQCGQKQYAFDSTYQLHLSLCENDLNRDIFVTDPIFGTGISMPLYLISQRFYQVLKQNNLTADVAFEPVVLI